MEEKALAIRDPSAMSQPANLMEHALTVEMVVRQRDLVKDVMAKLMVEHQHYGVIPGTDRPTLLQPGAEMLCTVFRFAPSFDNTFFDLPNGHRECRSTCALTHMPTGTVVGQLAASCSTMEVKYRYRDEDAVSTGERPPPEYWPLSKAKKYKEAQELIGGRGFKVIKTDDGYFIGRKTGQKIDNPNPEDLHNTIVKMAQKRALVGAVRLATGASDIFTTKDEGPDADHKHKEEVSKRNRASAGAVMNHEELKARLAGISDKAELLRFFNDNPKQFARDPRMHVIWKARLTELEREENQEIPCPNVEGRMIHVEGCLTCPTREGCPSHAPA